MKKSGSVLLTASLVALTVLTACGKTSPLAQYAPIIAPPAPTVVRNNTLPTVILSDKRPSLPDGKTATAIRFDMEGAPPAPATTATTQATDSEDVEEDVTEEVAATPTPSATPAPGQVLAGLSVAIGTTRRLTVEVTLNDGQKLSNYTNVNWASSNRDIGTVSASGIFTPTREGSTKITASIGGQATTIEITVTQGNFYWRQIQAPVQTNLYGVKMLTDTEAWAVGAGGTMLNFRNGTWYNLTNQLLPITNGANLYSIDFLSMYEGWAVGDNIILRYSNGRWTRVPVPVQGTFRSVDMQQASSFTPGIGYAPGTVFDPNMGLNTGYNTGYGYTNPAYPNTGYGTTPGMPGMPTYAGPVGWIVGESGGGPIALRFNAQTGWQPVATDIDHGLNGISVVGPNHAWAVGGSGRLSRPGIYFYNGQTWDKVRFTNALIDLNRPLGKYTMKAVKMVNSSQGWAVGEYEPPLSSLQGKRGAMYKYDAVNDIWTEVKVDATIDKRFRQVTYNGIGMLTPNKGWVLGSTITAALDLSPNNEINGNLMGTDGLSISPAQDYQVAALPQAFNAIDVLEHGNGIIVGDKGVVLHRQYDVNYRYQQGNFGNFNGQFGAGYDPNAMPTTGVGY
jgi:photosystem II stability/assembly factor-like uncharacterized protein